MGEHLLYQEEDFWKCRKHPSSTRGITGVCPSCLRDRLLLLCPDCGSLRPCPCFPPSSSSSSSSSISSIDPARSSVSGAVGAVGRISSLMEIEPPFQRSRSLVFPFRSGRDPPLRKRWFFSKEGKEDGANFTNISRSSSAGVAVYSDGRVKGWKWHFRVRCGRLGFGRGRKCYLDFLGGGYFKT